MFLFGFEEFAGVFGCFFLFSRRRRSDKDDGTAGDGSTESRGLRGWWDGFGLQASNEIYNFFGYIFIGKNQGKALFSY